jgi:hypothetical protein
MTKYPLIYRCGPDVVLIDPDREIRIGVYDFRPQALQAWAVYVGQGRQATGFDPTPRDYFVIDHWRQDGQQFNAKCDVRRVK